MSKVNSIMAAMGIKKAPKTAAVVKNTVKTATKPAMKEAKGAEILAAQNKAHIKMANPKSAKATSAGGDGGAGGGGDWGEW